MPDRQQWLQLSINRCNVLNMVMLRLILNILSMNLCYALVSFMSDCLSPSQRMKLLARCINAQPVYELFIAVFCSAGDHKSLVHTFVVYSMYAQSLNTARLVSHTVKNVHWTNWKKFRDVSRREWENWRVFLRRLGLRHPELRRLHVDLIVLYCYKIDFGLVSSIFWIYSCLKRAR